MRHLYKVVALFIALLMILSACSPVATPAPVANQPEVAVNQAPAATSVLAESEENVVEAPATPSLLGSWERTTSENEAGSFIFAVAAKFDFLQDGTYVVLPSNVSGQYSFPEDGRIKFQAQNGEETHKYTLSGDTLTFDPDGKPTVYKKTK